MMTKNSQTLGGQFPLKIEEWPQIESEVVKINQSFPHIKLRVPFENIQDFKNIYSMLEEKDRDVNKFKRRAEEIIRQNGLDDKVIWLRNLGFNAVIVWDNYEVETVESQMGLCKQFEAVPRVKILPS